MIQCSIHLPGFTRSLIVVLRRLLSLPQDLLNEASKNGGSSKIPTQTSEIAYIYTLFGYPLFPQAIHGLSNSSNRSMALTSPSSMNTLSFHSSTRIHNSGATHFQHQSISSMCGGICYQLLVLLANLFQKRSNVLELGNHQVLEFLFDILSVHSSEYGRLITDLDLLVIHKQLIRTLCKLVLTACETKDGLATLSDLHFILYLTRSLRQSELSTALHLELAQLLVFTIRVSLFVVFERNEIYFVFLIIDCFYRNPFR